MKKRFMSFSAIIMSLVMLLAFASCGVSTEDTEESKFVAATVDIGLDIPVSEQEIIDYYNALINKIQLSDTFTKENKPGLRLNESLHVDNINILAYDKATGTASESDSLAALNKSAKALKDRILGGIKTDNPVIKFGDMETSFDTAFYPYDNTQVALKAENVVKAECYADGNNLNIKIVLNNTPESIDSVFGTRNKDELISMFNAECKDYAVINDYSVNYNVFNLNDDGEEETVYSEINMSVELEQQEDGTYKSTGRITSLNMKAIVEVSANAQCVGSFKDNGDIQINFRFTDEMNYEFDWINEADWSV